MKDPAFLFYSDNFLSGTMFFTDEQIGKYIRLLCAQHLTGHLKENHMIFICKSYDKDIWDKFKKDDDGLYYNERLEEEIMKRRKYSESRSNNKKGKVKTCDKNEKSYDFHMGNGNGNENINNSLGGMGEISSKKKTKNQPEALQFPFTGPEFLEAWNKLITLPKWKKKPLSAIQISLNQLSKYDEEFSVKLIEKAHAGNYQGVVFDDTDEKFLKWKNQKNGQTFNTHKNGKLAGNYAAAEQLAREIEEKSRNFVSPLHKSS